MNKETLHKLANSLREVAARMEQEKTTKCANLIVGAMGLEVLSRKISERKL